MAGVVVVLMVAAADGSWSVRPPGRRRGPAPHPAEEREVLERAEERSSILSLTRGSDQATGSDPPGKAASV